MFKMSVGRAALLFFTMRGKMEHNTDEPIPGVEEGDEDYGLDDAVDRLVAAIDRFEIHVSFFYCGVYGRGGGGWWLVC